MVIPAPFIPQAVVMVQGDDSFVLPKAHDLIQVIRLSFSIAPRHKPGDVGRGSSQLTGSQTTSPPLGLKPRSNQQLLSKEDTAINQFDFRGRTCGNQC